MELIASWERIRKKFSVGDVDEKLPTSSEIVAYGLTVDPEYRESNRLVPISMISYTASGSTSTWTFSGNGCLNGSALTNVKEVSWTFYIDETPIESRTATQSSSSFSISYTGISRPTTLDIWFKKTDDTSYKNANSISLSSYSGYSVNLGNIALQHM